MAMTITPTTMVAIMVTSRMLSQPSHKHYKHSQIKSTKCIHQHKSHTTQTITTNHMVTISHIITIGNTIVDNNTRNIRSTNNRHK